MTKSPRRLLQVSLSLDLHAAIRDHCQQIQMPMAIWARELIRQELERLKQV